MLLCNPRRSQVAPGFLCYMDIIAYGAVPAGFNTLRVVIIKEAMLFGVAVVGP